MRVYIAAIITFRVNRVLLTCIIVMVVCDLSSTVTYLLSLLKLRCASLLKINLVGNL